MITAISSFLPTAILSNEQLAAEFSEWSAQKIYEKTGIRNRHIAGPEETASDLAEKAALKLFESIDRSEIDFLIFCTQSPDYILPPSACLLQHRLGLRSNIGAFDFNLGCSGYIYGLSMATALIGSQQAQKVLLLNADTYSKFIHPKDKSTRTIFGDAGTATLISATSRNRLHSFIFGTDGAGAEQILVKVGGCRFPAKSTVVEEREDESGNIKSPACLVMNGPEVFNFTIQAVPALMEGVLQKAQISAAEIDLFVFHQANAFMLEHLRRKLKIPKEKFVLALEEVGNTVSATIPLALESAKRAGQLKSPSRILLAGFGVGLSWGGCILEWQE